jgi:hypothetical protein
MQFAQSRNAEFLKNHAMRIKLPCLRQRVSMIVLLHKENDLPVQKYDNEHRTHLAAIQRLAFWD